MKDKNKKLIIVVGVLLLVIGVSFAYFVSTVLIGGNGAKTKMTTASINGATIEVNGTLTFSDLDIYPGHKTVSGIELIATGDGEFVPYNLVWNGENSLNTPLKFQVYKSESELEVSATCNKTTKIENGAQILAEECSISNIDNLGNTIYEGTINKNSNKVVLSNAEFITATREGTKVYYYVILEYPNLNEEQNIDIGGTFSGKVTVEENNSSADITIASIYKEEDNNYKEVEEIPEGRYVLNEERSTCTNNAKPTWNSEANTLQVSTLTTSGTECNLYFDKYIDTEKPIISNVATSVTKTEITINVTATDNIGVAEYWYQIDSNEPIQGTGNTHKFTGLSAGTTHTIKVYVKDEAGNQSYTTEKSVTTTKPTGSETILGNITIKSGTPNFANVATTDEGVYTTSDGMYGGTSYYWRGAATTNYVKFAGFCWRIVRINGDKSIRMIYDGSTCHANGTSTSENIASSIAYNSYNQSYYVGWTYSTAQRPSTANPQTSGTASAAKTQLESWYTNNIFGTNASKVADGKFCNDRNVGAPPSSWGWGTNYTTIWSASGTSFAYAGAKRLYETYAPTLSCSNGDIYNLKVGLITADEVEFAGGNASSNTSYYLYNGQYYWTMSPADWYGNTSRVSVFAVNGSGSFGGNITRQTYGLRPVINLKSDILFATGGNGTQSNPYVVAD